jgi:pimeloyl-ACP methyl ester carboxylesterase
VSTPRTLTLPAGVRRVTLHTSRGDFATLEALPGSGVHERQPALLIPGYTGSKEDFTSVLQPLAAAGRQVVAIDMRGQYQTPGPDDPGAYDIAALAADVALIGDQLSEGPPGAPVHLLGHSFGGLVAREILLARAAQVGSLTLMSSGPGGLTGPRAAVLKAILAELAMASSPEELAGQVKRLWDTHLEPDAVAGGVPGPIVEFLRTRMLASSPTGLRSMGENLLGCRDRTRALARLGTTPLMVVYGEEDDAWDPATQEDMALRLGADRVCIPGAAHSPAVEAPETTASTLTQFWNAAECRRR